MITKLAIVATGGALGSVFRFLLQTFSIHTFGIAFPYGTLAVNILGCLMMAFFVVGVTGLITRLGYRMKA